MRLLFVGCLFCVLSCIDSGQPRFVVKTVPAEGDAFIEWFNYSGFSSYGLDRIDYVDSAGNRTLIYKSHHVSDIAFDSGTIKIEWWKRGTFDAKKEIDGHVIKIDSGGCRFMSSVFRRRDGANWQEDICCKNIKIVEFERAHPDQYNVVE